MQDRKQGEAVSGSTVPAWLEGTAPHRLQEQQKHQQQCRRLGPAARAAARRRRERPVGATVFDLQSQLGWGKRIEIGGWDTGCEGLGG